MGKKGIEAEVMRRVEELTQYCKDNRLNIICLVGDDESLVAGTLNASVVDVGNMLNALSYHGNDYTLALRIADNIYHGSEKLISKYNEQKCS